MYRKQHEKSGNEGCVGGTSLQVDQYPSELISKWINFHFHQQ